MADDRDEQLAMMFEQLEEATELLIREDKLGLFLNHAATMWRYSPNNVLLLFAQGQDRGISPSIVAGFQEWKREGRHPRRGETGLRILAPIARRRYDVELPTGDRIAVARKSDVPSDGRIVDVKESRANRFRSIPVWDVSQTDGAPIVVDESDLIGAESGELFEKLVDHAADLGFTTRVSDVQYGLSGGYTDHSNNEIVVAAWTSVTERTAVMAHEFAHAALHGPGDELGAGYATSRHARGLAEVEAEIAAYLVLKGHGVDVTERSAGYLAGWADVVTVTASNAGDGTPTSRGDVLRRALARAHAVAKTALMATGASGGGKPFHEHAAMAIADGVQPEKQVSLAPLVAPPAPRNESRLGL